MLVLSRKKDESIAISKDIVVKVLSVKGNTVRLGIEAPEEVKIVRTEIFEDEG
jgi:carbon storage regulator